jgi:hypothetical protein
MMNNELNTVSLLEELRLPDDFNQPAIGIKKPLKPTFGKLSKHRFSRVNPSPQYKYRAALVLDNEKTDEAYLALPSLCPLLGSLAKPKILRLAVDNAGTPRLIAEPIPGADGRINSWHESTIRAIQMAEDKWVRIESNPDASQYIVIVSRDDQGDPKWPEQTMDELVMECFRDRIIQSTDHPLIRRLEGRF